MEDLEAIIARALAEFGGAAEPAALENAKARYLGKEGSLTGLLKGLGKLAPEERPGAGARINEVKQQIEAALQARRDALQQHALNARLAAEALDVTLPGRPALRGRLPDARHVAVFLKLSAYRVVPTLPAGPGCQERPATAHGESRSHRSKPVTATGGLM